MELDVERPTILVFGGSQGAQRLNTAVVESWKLMAQQSPSFQIIHITGERDFVRMEQAYRSVPMRSRLRPYCHTMPAAYAAADLVLCRSGASTVAELIATRRESILVPFPYASGNHQLFNARILAEAGVAQILTENELTSERLAALFKAMLSSRSGKDLQFAFARLAEKVHTLDAAQRLAQQVESLIPAQKLL